MPVIIQGFFGKPPEGEENLTGSLERSPLALFMVVPLTLTAIFSVLFGFYPNLFLEIISVLDINFFAGLFGQPLAGF